MFTAALWATIVIASSPVPRLSLNWHAPADCPDGEWVLREVERQRGAAQVVVVTDSADVRADATVHLESTRWVLNLQTHSQRGDGTRKLETDNCVAAAQAAALVLSLALESFEEPPTTSTPTQGTAPPQPLDVKAPTPTELRVAVLGHARLGPLPDVAPGATLSLGAGRKAWSVDVFVRTPNGQRRGPVVIDLPLSGGLAGCFAVRSPFAVCAGVEAGWLRAYGTADTSAGRGSAGWGAAEAGVQVRIPLAYGFAFRADAMAGVSWLQPRIVALGIDVYRVGWFSGQLGAGLEFGL